MVVTRSMAKKDNAKNGGFNKFASSRVHYKAHSTDAVVPRDVARGAVDNRASARSKVAKSNSALRPTIPKEDKSARTRSRSDIPPRNSSCKNDRKSTRTKKPSRSTQATIKKRGLKSKKDSDNSIASTTSPTVVGSGEDEYKKEDNTRHPSTRGVKRKSDDEENAPKFERGPRVNTRRIRQRLETQPDKTEARNGRVGVIQKNRIHDGRPIEVPRRSSRLAAKTSLSIPQQDRRRSNRSRKKQCLEHVPAKEISLLRKRKRNDEEADDVIEAPGPSRRVRRRPLEGSDHSEGENEGKSSSASGTSTDSPQETLVNEESNPQKTSGPGSDEASPLTSSLPMNGEPVSEPTSPNPRGHSHGRHMSIESVPSAIWSEGVKNEPRSPSIESLLTPPPYIKEEEEEIVLINQDLDMMIPLASRDAEEDGAGAVLTHLLQLEDEDPGDEQLIEADEDTHDHAVMNRYRSLAPEPDQGLINAIRSGEISGLASPPPSMHEAS
ncbi:hypothetical protein ACEPAF_1738 [Sanghuangporus sanghuang]